MNVSPLADRLMLAVPSHYSSRDGAVVDTVIWHHMGSEHGETITGQMAAGTIPVSANYTILSNGLITCVVKEHLRAHTSGSRYDGGKGAAWDKRAITVEIENIKLSNGKFGIAQLALQAAARLLQDLRSRLTIINNYGHRELWERFKASYPTECPGVGTVQSILNLAQGDIPMSIQYTRIDGHRVEVNVAAAFHRMAADFQKRFGLRLHVSSGTRTWQEQLNFWNLFQAGRGNLALHPSSPLAYHVETNPKGPRALDIRDSGSNAGVTTAGNARSNWIRQNAHRYGFDPAGYRFSQIEPWHIEYTGRVGGKVQGSTSNLSETVKSRQRFLRNHGGLYTGGIDGIPGPLYVAAVKKYQGQLGVTRDGIWGAATEAAHKARQSGGGSSSTSSTSETVKSRQRYLRNNGGFYSGAIDGIPGPLYTAAVRSYQSLLGVTPDGIWGNGTETAHKRLQDNMETVKSRQRFLRNNGTYTGGIDGLPGPLYIAAVKTYQRKLGVTADGIWGAGTERAHQRRR